MRLTTTDMILNRVKTAKGKLVQHRSLGSKSSLSIIEVAQLLDTIKSGEGTNQAHMDTIFFSLN